MDKKITYRGKLLQDMDRDELIEAVETVGDLYQDAISLSPRELTPQPLPPKEVISIQPGDVVVVKTDITLSGNGYDTLVSDIEFAFPESNYIILHQGMTLEVYREQGKGYCKFYDKACMGDLCSDGIPETCQYREQEKVDPKEYGIKRTGTGMQYE